jgi:hypothetical protein
MKQEAYQKRRKENGEFIRAFFVTSYPGVGISLHLCRLLSTERGSLCKKQPPKRKYLKLRFP